MHGFRSGRRLLGEGMPTPGPGCGLIRIGQAAGSMRVGLPAACGVLRTVGAGPNRICDERISPTERPWGHSAAVRCGDVLHPSNGLVRDPHGSEDPVVEIILTQQHGVDASEEIS